MAKILEVGDFIYDDNKRPHNRYEVTAVTPKMCTVYNKRTNTKAKAKRHINQYGYYNLIGVYGGGHIVGEDAVKYYDRHVQSENEKHRINKMQNQMYNTKWREVPAEKLEAIIKILETN